MIKDIEEESKTKFSIKVEFSFSFKGHDLPESKQLTHHHMGVMISLNTET